MRSMIATWVCLLVPIAPIHGQDLIPKEGFIARPVGARPGLPFVVDEVQARLVEGTWKSPVEGNTIKLASGGEGKWEKVAFDKDGRTGAKAMFGAYLSVPLDVTKTGFYQLEAAGHSIVYVNGEPRIGDVYASNNVRLPVFLREGKNELLFYGSRGQVQVKLRSMEEGQKLQGEALLPDVFEGMERDYWASIVVANFSQSPLKDGKLVVRFAEKDTTFDVPTLPPLSTRAIAFKLQGTRDLKPGKNEVNISLLVRGAARDKRALNVPVVPPEKNHRRTFISQIDGSVQYYAVVPACTKDKDTRREKPGLILTLHGASVEASGQAAAYSCKPWCHVVAPTNRRPFGFDWEDWGRLDAMEVLEIASRELSIDPQKVWLTGHSMGGHGTWHIGVTYPDRFAAIGPSAGWISFWTYGRGPRTTPKDAVTEMFHRANNSSDTPALLRNLDQIGVYVLHGDKDDNVPVTQARTMVKLLSEFHKDTQVHEQKGAGHWWDLPGDGADCVDWRPMMELFQKRALPTRDEVSRIDFMTASPGVSPRSHWAEIVQQVQPMKLSRIQLKREKEQIEGATTNVRILSLLLDAKTGWNIKLDGATLKVKADKDGRVVLRKDGAGWTQSKQVNPAEKHPARYGPFRDAFRNRMVFVYGTKGNDEENAWAMRKARFDAESFWYRGNGSVDIVADRDFDPEKDRDRNVILYGNAETNACWDRLLKKCPVRVTRESVRIEDRTEKGSNLACLFLYPREGSDTACVGVVSGTGVQGCRMTYRMPVFVSGVGYPDLVLVSTEVLRQSSSPGLLAAGYFSNDWRVKGGEFAWQK